MSPSRRLVVAWYREDISWVQAAVMAAASVDDADDAVSISVYSKGGLQEDEGLRASRSVEVVSLPNRGREAETYLHHICAHYDDLEDLTYFVQGDPAPHMSVIKRNRSLVPSRIFGDDVAKDAKESKETKEGPLLTTYMNEAHPPAFHERVNVHGAAKYLLGSQCATYSFAAGAQYVVSRASIHKRPLEFWQRAHQALIDDTVNAWEIERLWPLLFWPADQD